MGTSKAWAVPQPGKMLAPCPHVNDILYTYCFRGSAISYALHLNPKPLFLSQNRQNKMFIAVCAGCCWEPAASDPILGGAAPDQSERDFLLRCMLKFLHSQQFTVGRAGTLTLAFKYVHRSFCLLDTHLDLSELDRCRD